MEAVINAYCSIQYIGFDLMQINIPGNSLSLACCRRKICVPVPVEGMKLFQIIDYIYIAY